MSNHISPESPPFVVCPVCEGHGSTGPGWVMTQEDIDDMGQDEFYDYMRNMREGMYNVACDNCEGQRVVKSECPCEDCEAEREQDWQDRQAAAFEARWC